MPPKTNPQKIVPRNNPPHKSYKHIAVIFVIIALVLALGVVYLALSKVTITLTPLNQAITHSFELTLAAEPLLDQSSPSLQGQFVVKEEKKEEKFPVSQGKTVNAVASGKVTLYNDRSEAQTLIATTRLLTPDNVLFRLKNKVVLPAKTQLVADVYADQAGPSGNIGPTNFSIPGLSESLQKFVYAKADSAMSGGTKQIGVLSQADIDAAKEKLLSTLRQDSEPEAKTAMENSALIASKAEITAASFKPALGTETDSFTLSAAFQAVNVYADKEAILNQAKEEIKKSQSLPADSINIDPASLEYKLTAVDLENKKAVLQVSIAGLADLDPNRDIFDKNLLVGFTADDLRLYFSQFESIKDVQIKFSPFWVKKVPLLKDHIIIKIKK